MAYGDKWWHIPATVLGVGAGVFVVASIASPSTALAAPPGTTPDAGKGPVQRAAKAVTRTATKVSNYVSPNALQDEAFEASGDNDNSAGKDFDGSGDVSTSERNRGDSQQA